MRVKRIFAVLLFAIALVAIASPEAAAQTAKLGKKYFEDTEHGYRFRYPDKWLVLPVQSHHKELGLVGRMDGPDTPTMVGNAAWISHPDVRVVKIADEEVHTAGSEESSLRRRVKKSSGGRRDISEIIEGLFSVQDFKADEPIEDEEKKIKKLVAHHRSWKAHTGNIDQIFDTWTFRLNDYDIVLLFSVSEQHSKKWLRVFEKAAKTFDLIERERASSLKDDSTYAEQLEYYTEVAERTPGWRVVPTPSEKYVVVTSSDNKKFIGEVIERLELSRELFERDFPPKVDMNHVSVVRVCATADEFHAYGGTGGGTAGWFSPTTTELVLYDAVEYDRNMTYAVMSHEGFHQYCHFMFDQSEAHRWFDEGHGDYYGGAKFFRKKAEITPKMPAGLYRFGVIKEMIQQRTYKPLIEHLNFNHQEWQTQGPTGVSCYSQSWSIIYMLRQGTLGKITRKVWKKEYAEILPNYIEALNAGFGEAYKKIREKREENAKNAGEELSEEDLDINRFDISPDDKEEIWKKAMNASWGQINLDEFEANWLIYVKKYLK